MTAATEGPVDVLAIGAHPDDVELCCGGTLARFAADGRRVGIAHLTRGEMATRGTVEERAAEAREAGRRLGAATVDLLDCGDGGLRTGAAEEDAVIDLIRRRRPEIVLAPPADDRHPDHVRAHRLVVEACFYAGLRRRGEGAAHRPAAVWTYMQHHEFRPAFVVDVTDVWERKVSALEAYASQLATSRSSTRAEPMTKVSSPEFWAAIEGRARHYGQQIGVALGEPFGSAVPLAVRDPWALVPRGLR